MRHFLTAAGALAALMMLTAGGLSGCNDTDVNNADKAFHQVAAGTKQADQTIAHGTKKAAESVEHSIHEHTK